MPLMQVLPNPPSVASIPDGGTGVTMLGGKQGEGIVAELHGKYYTQTVRSKLWYANIFTATAIPVFATNATPNFFIWNPSNNTTNVVLVRATYGFHAGTGIAGALGYAYIQNVTSLVGTAAPVSAATTTTILPGLIGNAAYGGNVVAGSAATVSGTAPFALKQHSWSPISQGAPITSTASYWSLVHEFDGSMILAPGTFWCPLGSVAVAETFMISVAAYEAPV